MTKFTYTSKYTYPKFLAEKLYFAKVFKVLYEQEIYFFTLYVVSNFAFFHKFNFSLIYRFVEGIMRSYHWSNQHKHFNKSNVMNQPQFSTTEKLYLTFYDTNNYKNDKYNSCAVSVFNETHIFRR